MSCRGDAVQLLSTLAEAAVAAYPALSLSIAYINGSDVSVMHHGGNLIQTPTDSTLYEIGSITKTFTGALLAAAVANSDVTLSTPVKVCLLWRCDPVLLLSARVVPQSLPACCASVLTGMLKETKPARNHILAHYFLRSNRKAEVEQEPQRTIRPLSIQLHLKASSHSSIKLLKLLFWLFNSF